MRVHIECRSRHLINTDPQRRCYNGCNYSEALVWSQWDILEFSIPAERAEERLKFWRELNDYAVSQRGQSAKTEFRSVPYEKPTVPADKAA